MMKLSELLTLKSPDYSEDLWSRTGEFQLSKNCGTNSPTTRRQSVRTPMLATLPAPAKCSPATAASAVSALSAVKPMGGVAVQKKPSTTTSELTRPQTRGDCAKGPRPCPWVSCAHHLALDVGDSEKRGDALRSPTWEGAVITGQSSHDTFLAFANSVTDALEGMPYTCSIDAAEASEWTGDDIAEMLGVSRQRVQQIEAKGLALLKPKVLKLLDE